MRVIHVIQAFLPVHLLMFAAAPLLHPAPPPGVPGLKKEARDLVRANATLTQQMVDSIFSFSELGFQEFETSAYVTNILEKAGFTVTRGVAGMPTAFVASWGSGSPVIGFIADIDGLPETSQKPGVAYHDPLIPGGPGHGEGHNAGQAVNVTAAIAVKQLMQKYQIPGTIRVYPGVAEELLASRAYMVNAGLFRDLDVMLSTHIAAEFGTGYGPIGSGLVSTQYSFHGQSAHAAGSPWKGRSALDAVELMDVRLELPSRASPPRATLALRHRARRRSTQCRPARSHRLVFLPRVGLRPHPRLACAWHQNGASRRHND